MKECAAAARKGAAIAAIWSVVSFPCTRYVVKHLNPLKISKYDEKSSLFGVNIVTYASLMFVLGQCSMIIEYFLARRLKTARKHAYDATVASRGKESSFWIPYQEEWLEPPIERAKRAAIKSGFHDKINSPIVRMIILRALLLPLAFIPFLGMFISAFLRSLTLAKILHQPYFKAKNMSEFEQELFMVERQFEYRSFGFVAALLERTPLIGLIFSISNRIGAAMWAHSLEKQQHAFASGEKKPTRVYQSKTAALPPSDLPESFAGGFPTKKGPVLIGPEGIADVVSPERADRGPRQRNVPPKWEGQ